MPAVEVLLPKLGMAMQEGVILAWFVAVGDQVKEGDPLVEIETEKASTELPSPATGILSEICIPAGQSAQPGAVLAILTPEGEAAP